MRTTLIALAAVLASPITVQAATYTAPKTASNQTSASSPQITVSHHVVAKGENDWLIARMEGISVDALHAANPGVNWRLLQIGQRLILSKVSIATTAKTVAPKPKTYVVRKNDNDWVIAERLGINAHQLRAANPDVRWTRLQIGQKLDLPSGTVVSAPVAKASSRSIHSSYARIVREGVNIRRGPGSDYGTVALAQYGSTVAVLANKGDWYKLRFPRGSVGWVREDMLKPVVTSRVSRSYHAATHDSGDAAPTKAIAYSPTTGNKVVDRALSMQGVRYRWAMASRSGTDCSGLTTQVFRSVGVTLPRTSHEQAKVGAKVAKTELKPGDMVFFRTRGKRRGVSHVGIYIGNGKFVHASSSKRRVRVDSLSNSYYNNRFVTARRVKGKVPSQTSASKRKVAEGIPFTPGARNCNLVATDNTGPAPSDK